MKLSTIQRYQNNEFRHFGSVREFLDAARPVASKFRHDERWAGGSFADAVKFCELGDVEAVPTASRYADMINDAVELAGVRSEWSPDVVGAFPSVPAFLAGDPCSMWARSPVQDERGEINVYFDLAASCKAKVENMRRRGVCVLALLLALQRVRNVRAHLYTSHIGGNFTLDFSHPLDVSEIAAFCGRPVVTRILTYCFCEDLALRQSSALGCKLFGRVFSAAWCEKCTNSRVGEILALRSFAGVPAGSLVVGQGKMWTLEGMTDKQFIEYINGVVETVNGGGDPDAVNI